MKKILIGMLAIVSFAFSANAQEVGKTEHHRHHHQKSMMMKGINFSEAQKNQMRANRENIKNQLAELNKNEDITVKEYKARKRDILKLRREQFDKVLTPEQKEQLAKNQTERKEKREAYAAKRLDKMKASLQLSDEQVLKIKSNREAGMTKAKAIRENSQLNGQEKKDQLIALKKEQKNNFKQLLTTEQVNKLEELKKDRQDKPGRK